MKFEYRRWKGGILNDKLGIALVRHQTWVELNIWLWFWDFCFRVYP